MAPTSAEVKAIFRRILIGGLLIGAGLGSFPSVGAPINHYSIANPDSGSGSSDSTRQLDAMPCRIGPGRNEAALSHNSDCPNVYGNATAEPRTRRPAPSAFGLQFDTGDD